jgi:hypothetical protein
MNITDLEEDGCGPSDVSLQRVKKSSNTLNTEIRLQERSLFRDLSLFTLVRLHSSASHSLKWTIGIITDVLEAASEENRKRE